MKLAIFGLSISSSWGNGHATLWRGLCRALIARGHRIVFFERDVPYYAEHRDLHELPGGKLILYPQWEEVASVASREVYDSDVAIVTSFCPDAGAASELVLSASRPLRMFYDLDSPVTLERVGRGEPVEYIGPRGLRDFDLVLSYTGGAALDALRDLLGAKKVAPLYGSVDPEVHRPVPRDQRYRCELSYLGTYAADRQRQLHALFIEPARRMRHHKFLLGGSQYPLDFPWSENIFFFPHVPPGDHPAFYSSSRMTLNVTRGAMAAMGYCPSGRLFEAAACGTPILSDRWEGLEQFFQPGAEIVIAHDTSSALEALGMTDLELSAIARRARERTLAQHTASCRAIDFENAIELAARGEPEEASSRM